MRILSISLATTLISLMACGGGGSDDSDAPAVAPTNVTWTQGQFENESQFKDFCALPRGGGFPDKAGSILLENHWLRVWNNDTYLWYDEVIDQDPALFNDPLVYFNELKTENITASGAQKDNFHFTQNTAEYQKQNQSGVSSGYGLRWALIASSPPRQLKVAYVEDSGSASANGISRGAEILEIDGVDLVNGSDTDTLNDGIYPSEAGESHTFLVRDLGSATTRTVTLVAADIQAAAVLENQVIDTPSGKVGYLMYNNFRAYSETALVDAFTQLATENIDDLVLDLRYNGGGLLDLSSGLGYMIAGADNTENAIFERTLFNDQHPDFNPVTGSALTPIPFHYETTGFASLDAGIALPTLSLNRVFILSTASTCSASESLINGLRGIDVEVILIGDTTCGKPYGFYPTDNCGTTYFTIQLTGANNKGFGEYSDGFSPQNSTSSFGVSVPGCSVADDYSHLLGDNDEGLLKQALEYRDTGTCSAQPANKDQLSSQKQHSGSTIKEPKVWNEKILSRGQRK